MREGWSGMRRTPLIMRLQLPFVVCPLLSLAMLISCSSPDLQLLPVLIVTSNTATNSVKTASTWSSPAITLIISELGFVYFLGSTAERNAVMVCSVSLVSSPRNIIPYIKSMRICRSTSCFTAYYRPREQLPCLRLQLQSTPASPTISPISYLKMQQIVGT